MATDSGVRDFASRATIKDDTVTVMVKLNVKNGEIARSSFTVQDWLGALKKWPNEHYAADEFVKGHFWSQFSEDAPAINQRLIDSIIRATRKAVAALSTQDQPTMSKAEQFVSDGLSACLPPGTPFMGRIAEAKFTGKERAEAEVILFDGKPGTVEISKHGPRKDAWSQRWLVLAGGDINWTGSAWERVVRVTVQANLFAAIAALETA